jgi:hypothetical protein
MPKKKKKELSQTEKAKKFVTSYPFLYGTLAFLFVVVLMLGMMVLVKKQEKKDNTANLVIPILEDGTHNSMKIDLSTLKDQEYIIKVTNYRGKVVNQEEVQYTITIRNDTNSQIEVIKDKENENLMVDQEATRIEGVTLNSKKKQEDIYHIHLQPNQNPKSGDMITIEIAS